MDSSSSKTYQDFEPRFDWTHHADSHVLIVHLLGFRSNQLKVQVTSTGKLRVSGERRLGSGKWLRFQKEIDIPSDADTDNISAKLEEGVLYVKHPKKPSAASSISPPAQQQQPKPKAESQPTPPVTKPKPEPTKPAAVKPTVDPPTVQPKTPKNQTERADLPKPAAARPTVDPPTVRPNAPKSQNERPQSQPSAKQIPTPPKPQEATGAAAKIPKPTETPSIGSGQPSQGLALKDKTEEKAKAHTKLQDALKKTKEEEVGSKMEEEGKEGGGSKMAEENEGVVAEGRRRRRRKRRSEEMVEETGRVRRRGGYKQVIDGVVKELRSNMVTLVLGVAVFVIVYLNLSKKGNVEEEL